MIGFDTLQGSDVYHWLLHFVQQCAANGFWERIERIIGLSLLVERMDKGQRWLVVEVWGTDLKNDVSVQPCLETRIFDSAARDRYSKTIRVY